MAEAGRTRSPGLLPTHRAIKPGRSGAEPFPAVGAARGVPLGAPPFPAAPAGRRRAQARWLGRAVRVRGRGSSRAAPGGAGAGGPWGRCGRERSARLGSVRFGSVRLGAGAAPQSHGRTRGSGRGRRGAAELRQDEREARRARRGRGEPEQAQAGKRTGRREGNGRASSRRRRRGRGCGEWGAREPFRGWKAFKPVGGLGGCSERQRPEGPWGFPGGATPGWALDRGSSHARAGTATALPRNLCPAPLTERGVRPALYEQSRTLMVMMHTTCLPVERLT